MAAQNFVHLHTHSQYSILDASASVAQLVKKASSWGMQALALTDHGNLFGAVEFYKACKDQKIKAIIGCEIFLAPTSRHEKKKISGLPTAFHLTLLAKDRKGYQNLCKLSSIGYTDGFYYSPRIDFETLAKHSEGLICLSGCIQSPFAWEILNGTAEKAQEMLLSYKNIFQDNFYIELQRHKTTREDLQLEGYFDESWLYQQYQEYTQKQEKVNLTLQELSKQLDIQCAATNNVHYIEREDWKAHEILLNIQSGEPCEIWERDSYGNPKFRIPNPKRATFATHEMYMKSPDEMYSLFSDCPEALQTTCEIADKCKLDMDFATKHYPVFIPKELKGKEYTSEDRAKAVEKFLWDLCIQAIPKRYTENILKRVQEKYPEQDPLQVVHKRLEYEMSIISPKGMCDYLLIVWDFIFWAKSNGIPMGPGRGSGAGSIILYLTGITDIEPLQFNLFFERFINPERLSYPDIDVDICMDRRSEVINYTIGEYGKENVAQIITFGSMKAKMVVKDVGRVLNIPLSKVNIIAKLIPEDLNITLDKALEKDPDLKSFYQQDEEARRVIDIGRKLEGSIRNTGIHAAGMIIAGEPLTEYIPVCIAKDSDMLVTQYSMKPVESVGMLKVDFLGLKTLTCIKRCVDAIAETTGKTIDWINLPFDDAPTFSLLNQGRTLGVFQLESGGMQELAKQLHLDKFEEIIAVLSLYRPGPMDMIPSFIQRKHGQEPIEYDHPWLQDILAETYGIMVYQEQVMQIASKLANYSLGEGDVLRRAMGKKDMNEMAKQRQKFTQGCLANNIDEAVATQIFDKMEKFAEYGFNKSHAAAYGYLTYVTAFLKANYPSQWLAALMTCDSDDITKVAKFFHEGQTMGIPMLPPDVNESDAPFLATPKGIRFAMSGIKGVGIGVVEAILEERKKNGPFKSLYNFVKRIDTKRVGKKAVELLIDSGAFDFTGWHRDALKQSLDAMYEQVVRQHKDHASGVMSLFATIEDDEKVFAKAPKVVTPRSKEELLFREKELLGLFLTGHPLDAYQDILKHLGTVPLSKFAELPADSVFRTAFIIEQVQPRIASKSQKKFAILTISDGSAEQYELPIWPEMYEEKHEIIVENRLIWAVLTKERKDKDTQISCKWFSDLKQINEKLVQECDMAYDRAKQQIQRQRHALNGKEGQAAKSSKNTKPQEQTKKQEPEAPQEKFVISVDLDVLRASHILYLQAALSTSQGNVPIEVHFSSSGQEIAGLHIDKVNGIEPATTLIKKISEIPSVIQCEHLLE